ncbi:MAG: helix-turn-helix domain-containing protein [Pseudomonadota bacterium]
MSKFFPIGGRLREERDRLGLSQTDFAALGGASRKTQFNYETGERVPDGAYLAAIAAAGADVLYILTGQRGSAITTPAQPTNPREKVLLEKYRAAPPEVQDATQTLLDAAAQQHASKLKRR